MEDNNIVQAIIDKNTRNDLSSFNNYINLKQISMMLQTLIEEKRRESELANKQIEKEKNKVKDMVRAVDEAAKPLTEEEEPGLEQTISQALKETNTDRNLLIQAMLESLSPIEKLELGKTISRYFTKEEEVERNYKETNTLALNIEDIISPRESLALVDKITYTLAAGNIPYREEVPFKMEKGRSKNKKTTYLTLDTEVLEELLPDNINGEDINLLESIMTLVEAHLIIGRNVFTFNEIYRVEKRNLDTRPSKAAQDSLEKRLIKLMTTLITLDPREENPYYPNLVWKRTTNLLKAEIIEEVELNTGNTTKALKVDEMPLLYDYARDKDQLTRIPLKLTDNGLRKTSAVLILEKYLLRRIAQMRNRKNISRNILFDTIYDNMNFKQRSKSAIENAKARTRENTEEILKGLIRNEYIKDYNIISQGRTKYHKLEIIL